MVIVLKSTAGPNPPILVAADPGDRSALIRWQAVAVTSRAISKYTITATGNGATITLDAAPTLRSVTLSPLQNSVDYTVTVTATDVGAVESAPSNALVVRPVGVVVVSDPLPGTDPVPVPDPTPAPDVPDNTTPMSAPVLSAFAVSATFHPSNWMLPAPPVVVPQRPPTPTTPPPVVVSPDPDPTAPPPPVTQLGQVEIGYDTLGRPYLLGPGQPASARPVDLDGYEIGYDANGHPYLLGPTDPKPATTPPDGVEVAYDTLGRPYLVTGP